jgi:hypothetical protein
MSYPPGDEERVFAVEALQIKPAKNLGIGQCCNLERAGTGRARYGTASSRNLEQSCNEIETALNLSDPY